MPTVRPMTVRGSLGLKADDPGSLHDSILTGMPVAALDRFTSESGLPARSINDVVQIPPRTLARRRVSGRLSAEESERLCRLARLFALTVEFMNGDTAAAGRWLQRSAPALGGRVPLEFARTDVGGQRVEALIWQLRNGVVV